MKLFSRVLELKALRLATVPKNKIGNYITSRLDRKAFGYAPCLEAFERICVVLKNTGKIPTWLEVCHDPAISEDTRKILTTFKARDKFPSREKSDRLLKQLSIYRKTRQTFSLLEDTRDKLIAPKVDIDEVIQDLSTGIAEMRYDKAAVKFWNVGTGNNTSDILKSIMDPEDENAIPTGIKAFDETNVGLFRGSLMVIAGTTSGGKSVVALQLCKNMAMAGARCALVPLEMNTKSQMQRLVSSLSKVPMGTVINPRIQTSADKKKMVGSYARFVKDNKKKKSTLSFVELSQDETIEDLLLSMEPQEFDVICIDYISLLKGAAGDDQWMKLGEIARFCKVYATQKNCVIILVAQLSEEGQVRYARSIFEHASNAWKWIRDKRAKEERILRIEQPKSRNQSGFPFFVQERFDIMSVLDVTEEQKRRLMASLDDDVTDIKSARRYGGKDEKKEPLSKKMNVVEDDNYFEDLTAEDKEAA